MKICIACCKEKTEGEFYRRRDTGRLRNTCKQCVKDRNHAYYEQNREQCSTQAVEWQRANPERTFARIHAWRKAHPERAQEIDKRASQKRAERLVTQRLGQFGRREIEQRLSMFDGCWMCSAPADHTDHVKPLAAGGAHALANIRPICASCNSKKGAIWPIPTSIRRATS